MRCGVLSNLSFQKAKIFGLSNGNTPIFDPFNLFLEHSCYRAVVVLL